MHNPDYFGHDESDEYEEGKITRWDRYIPRGA